MFQDQILLQCDFVVYASSDLNESLKQEDSRKTFFAIQNLLGSTANISEVLWGVNQTLSVERKPVRDSIGVTESSPLKTRAMRNNYDHFDERLDRWYEESQAHAYTDLNVMPRGFIAGLNEIDIFRWFDPKTTNVIFWSENFNIQEIVDCRRSAIMGHFCPLPRIGRLAYTSATDLAADPRVSQR